MYILDIVPLALIPRSQDQLLSYYHSDPLPVGAVVEAPLNRRKLPGIVVGCDAIKQRKLLYKKAVDFELKNITRAISAEPLVSRRQLQIAKYLSDYYYAPLGICLKTVLPAFFLKKGFSCKPSAIRHRPPQKFILIPEKILGDHYQKKYRAEVFVSGEMKNKVYYDLWQKVAAGKIRTIVGTRVGLFLPFQNLTELIVADESNAAYKSDMTPRYQAVDLARFIAGRDGAKISYCSPVPRLETWHQQAQPGAPLYKGAPGKATVVNMISEIKAGNFSIFSRDLKDYLLDIASPTSDLHYRKIILYIPRRGHANYLACEHCGTPSKCPNCSAALVLHRVPAERLICHRCNYSQSWPKTCPACGGHKFKSYGIGIEKVASELDKFFKYLNLETPPLFRLDSDSVKDETAEKKIIADFVTTDSAILLATPMLFSQAPLLRADICGIISADTLTNIPDFRAEESLFRQIYRLGALADKLIIQTRNPDDVAIRLAAAGKVKEFFAQEMENRRALGYPPFSQLVKLTYRQRDPLHAQTAAVLLAEKLKQALRIKHYELSIELLGPAPAFVSQERGLFVWNIVLKIGKPADAKAMAGEVKKRNELLRLVPSGWVIDVDPRNVI